MSHVEAFLSLLFLFSCYLSICPFCYIPSVPTSCFKTGLFHLHPAVYLSFCSLHRFGDIIYLILVILFSCYLSISLFCFIPSVHISCFKTVFLFICIRPFICSFAFSTDLVIEFTEVLLILFSCYLSIRPFCFIPSVHISCFKTVFFFHLHPAVYLFFCILHRFGDRIY